MIQNIDNKGHNFIRMKSFSFINGEFVVTGVLPYVYCSACFIQARIEGDEHNTSDPKAVLTCGEIIAKEIL